jgi:hypothetical protein
VREIITSSDITSVDGGAQRVTPRSLENPAAFFFEIKENPAADQRSRTVLAIPEKVNTVKTLLGNGKCSPSYTAPFFLQNSN